MEKEEETVHFAMVEPPKREMTEKEVQKAVDEKLQDGSDGLNEYMKQIMEWGFEVELVQRLKYDGYTLEDEKTRQRGLFLKPRYTCTLSEVKVHKKHKLVDALNSARHSKK